MQSTNLSKQYPINISIFDSFIDESIFEDIRFVQLMNLLIKDVGNAYKYSYCFYTDKSMLKTNIFIPIFHTLYLGCRTNNVIIKNSNDVWLTSIYKHNNYYVIAKEEDKYDYDQHGIIKITDISEIKGCI